MWRQGGGIIGKQMQTLGIKLALGVGLVMALFAANVPAQSTPNASSPNAASAAAQPPRLRPALA